MLTKCMYYYVSEGNIIPTFPQPFVAHFTNILLKRLGIWKWGFGTVTAWTGLLDSPKTAKYTLFNTEQKLNILLIHSVISLALLPTVFPGFSRGQRPHAYLISFNNELQP